VFEVAAPISGLKALAAVPLTVLLNDKDLPLSMVEEGDIYLEELLLMVAIVPLD
jgi:hypothetical protein